MQIYRLNHLKFFLVFFNGLILCSCGGSDSAALDPVINARGIALNCSSPYAYQQPANSETGISVTSMQGKAIDSVLIVKMLSELHCGARDHGINSVLIDIGGDLVVEEYYPGFVSASNRQIIDYDLDTLHVQASVQKSFVSALLGIAVSEGYLQIDESLFSLFPEYSDIDWFEPYVISDENYQKADITIKDALIMSAGLAWDEGSTYYGHPNNSVTKMNQSADPFKYVFVQPLVSAPAQRFEYNTGLSNILKEILTRRTGVSVSEYAQQTLFNRLSIDNYFWDEHLSLRPRDMLKLGKTYLNKGMFGETQVVPAVWVEQSLARLVSLDAGERISGYGYQWWKSDFKIDGQIYQASAALGYGGQQIYIFEQFDAVVVFTSAEYPGQHSDAFTTYSWLNDFILPALISGATH